MTGSAGCDWLPTGQAPKPGRAGPALVARPRQVQVQVQVNGRQARARAVVVQVAGPVLLAGARVEVIRPTRPVPGATETGNRPGRGRGASARR